MCRADGTLRIEEKERLATDSKMVELLKDEVSSLRRQLKKQEENVACIQAREEALQQRWWQWFVTNARTWSLYTFSYL